MTALEPPAHRLADLITPRSIGDRTFEAMGVSGRTGRHFGGGLLAQMLMAAASEAPQAQAPHSLHGHFIAAGDPGKPIVYTTTTLRSSLRFTTTRIDAHQGSDLLATGTASFHSAESSPHHLAPMPEVSGAPALEPPAMGGPLPPTTAATRAPFDLREATGLPTAHRDGRPLLGYWVRSREDLGDSPSLHTAALAWVCDLVLTRVVDLEHEHRPGRRVAASLDHAMWFHGPVAAHRWMFYEIQSPAYSSALGLSTGRIFDHRGRLTASVGQESLLRRIDDGQD